MIKSNNAFLKIKYPFLKLTSDLFKDLSDVSIIISDIKFWPRYIMPVKFRDNELCFSNMFVYFEKTNIDIIFKARYQRKNEIDQIIRRLNDEYTPFAWVSEVINPNDPERFNKAFYIKTNQIAWETMQYITEPINIYKQGLISGIYQYYNLEDFVEDFPFYILYYDVNLILSIKSGDFWKSAI